MVDVADCSDVDVWFCSLEFSSCCFDGEVATAVSDGGGRVISRSPEEEICGGFGNKCGGKK